MNSRSWYVRVDDDKILEFPNRISARAAAFAARAEGHKTAIYQMTRRIVYEAAHQETASVA